MYPVKAFAVDDAPALLTVLLGSMAATLVTQGPGGLCSTILPVLYDPDVGEHGTITGHVARGNPIVCEAHDGEALVVVTGTDFYVTPSWYPSKAQHGKVVPTWNYVTVEAAGPLVLHDDPDWLLDLVTALTDRHEGERAEPWSVSDAPASYVAATLKGIVGIEVPLTRLAAKAKLSQTRPAADVAGVVAALRTDGFHALADAVERANPT